MNRFINFLKRFIKNEEGEVVVIVAILMVVMLSFAGAVTDFGMAYLNKSKLQTALDSAVLSGALKLPDTVLAEETAKEYIEKNGVSSQDIDITFNEDNSVISAESNGGINTYFLKIIGMNKIPYSAVASAKRSPNGIGGPFDYKIFSGDPNYTLVMGGNFNIDGSVHSNGSLSASPSKGTITGNAEACKSLFINNTTVGAKVPNAAKVDMIDFTDTVNYNMPSSYSTIWNSSQVNQEWRKQTWSGNIKILGDCSVSNQVVITGNVYVDGNLAINGGAPVCVLNGNLYVNGNVDFNNTAVVNGCIFAKNDINFRGGGLSLNTNDTVCVYSQIGNINISTSTSTLRGVVYAPNGTVSIAGGTTTFYGSIIGNKVTGIPANLVMKQPDVTFNFFKSTYSMSLVQ